MLEATLLSSSTQEFIGGRGRGCGCICNFTNLKPIFRCISCRIGVHTDVIEVEMQKNKQTNKK